MPTPLEQAGNLAQRRHHYRDAAELYRNALNCQGLSGTERLRITEKLTRMYLLVGDVRQATKLVDRLAKSPGRSSSRSAAVEPLLAVADHLSNEMKTREALPILARAAKIAKSGDAYLQTAVDLRRVRFYHHLDMDEEARRILSGISRPGRTAKSALHFAYFREKARAAVVLGMKQEAYQNFETALCAAKEHLDIYNATFVWGQYAFAAKALGDIERAKNCLESALLMARQYQFSSRVPRLCLPYAEILATMGRFALAREYVLDCLSYEVRSQIMTVRLASVGIPIALQLGDATLLKRCLRPRAVELAFQEGNPTNIGYVAVAYSRFYASRGDECGARKLLHRALGYIQRPDWNWEFPLAVAQNGNASDFSAARGLLERRLTLPCNEVAAACLSLFDALVAAREKPTHHIRSLATDAIQRLQALNWNGFLAYASPNLRLDLFKVTSVPNNLPFADRTLKLTSRERQVAELALQGSSNQAIAHQLSISVNTVEKHMSTIFERLGIRSRHQIAGALSL